MAEAAAHPDLSHAEWHSPVNPWLVALAVMSATFMEVLDTTVVNVSLPHIAGNLSASTEEATWVLTSYLVANAIILPATGWLSSRFGRKNFLTTCIVIFTLASALCGVASSLGMLILARVLQGAGGGALQPISQAVLLESFPPKRRGVAMAVFGLGVVVAPIIGPTLGGWITDNYSWRWVFYLNLPIGIMAVLLVQMMVIDPPYLRHGHHATKIDYIGFGLLALWVGSLQVMLDKGQQEDWLASPLIRVLAISALLGLLAFITWELCVEHPIVNLRILKNRNFAAGTALMTVVGAVLYASIALVPLFLQQLMGYSAVQSGMAISPRGLGSLCMMLVVGRLIGIIDSRFMIFCGFIILGFATMMFGDLSLSMAPRNITMPNIISGAALALLFVPLSTLAVATLSNREMGNATGIYNLMRNLGGSIGIAMVTTLLARNAQSHQVAMVAHLTPYDPVYQERLASITQGLTPTLGSVAASNAAPGIIYQTTLQQATLMAFVDDFRLLAIMCFLCVPAVFLFSKPKHHAALPAGVH